MEDYLGKISSEGETLCTSPRSRLRPPSRTGIFEDLGSSFKLQKSYSQGKKPTGSPRKRRSLSLSDFGSDDDDIDELDCFSQQSTRADTGRKGRPNSQIHKHSYHPDVLAGRSDALKKLKFTKKSGSTDGVEKKVSPRRPKPQPKAREARYRSDKESESEAEVYKPSRKEEGKPMASSTNTVSRPKPRPRPRPIPRPPQSPDDPSESLFGTPRAPSRTAPLSTIPLPSPLSHHKANAAPRKFNRSPPTANTSSSSSDSKSAASSSHPPPPSSGPSNRPTRPSPTPSKPAPRPPQRFPGVSPFNPPARKCSTAAVQNFPALSPLKSTKNLTLTKADKRKSKGKGKASDRILKPFPMSTQDFSDVPASSDGDSDADRHHARKRKYQEHIREISDMDLYDEEEDSLFMAPAVDPKTLCPYCDEPLPRTPTPHLHRLLQTLHKKSHPDPRSSNPLGRKAPLSAFASVCRRHRFESDILPEAEAKGWPKDIDWEQLRTRIENLKEGLCEIIDDPGPKNLDIEVLEGGKGGGERGMFMSTNFIGKGARLQCVFWREAMKVVLVRGTRALNGVRAQFLDFDRSLPGYYGELGSIIIHQTLLNMFPLDSFDPQTITPFAANDFIQRILIPEVALRLIMQDRKLKGFIGAETALQVLRDSTAYGAAMFPEDSGESAGSKDFDKDDGDNNNFDVGIGDRIVMERARKRRKEIEDEMEGYMGNATSKKEEEKKNRRERDSMPIETASEVDERTLRTSPRRRVPSRQKKKTGIGTDSDAMSITDGEGGTDAGMMTDRSLPRSRPKRNTRRVNYTDYSSDDGNNDQLERRGREKKSQSRHSQSSLSKSRISRSPSMDEWSIPRKVTEIEAKSHLKGLSLSPVDLLFSEEEEQMDSKNKSRTLVKKELGKKAYMGKDGEKEEIMDVDMDTPMPQRRAMESMAGNEDVDLTPRPGPKLDTASGSSKLGIAAHESVLARARARAQGINHDLSKKNAALATPRTKQSSKKAGWVPNMRSDPVSDDSDLALDASPSGSEDDEMFRKKWKGKDKDKKKEKEAEGNHWLLSDPSSQEGQSYTKRNTLSAR